MHRTLIALVALVATSCASGPDGGGEAESLVQTLNLPASSPRLVEIGEPAIPALRKSIGAEESPWRIQAIRTLALIWRNGHPSALEAYIEVVKASASDSTARRLLAEAHRFNDPDGRVYALLEAALKHMRVVTADMVLAAGAMSGEQALEAMMKVVGRSLDAATVPERDLALRYIGRAARRGRREAVEFLRACTQSSTPALIEKASAELSLLAGRLTPKSWSAWWFDHSKETRKEWLVQSFPPVGGKPFDPGERDHISELVARLPRDLDAEPEFWFLERVLGRSFGYLSPSDVFDPDVNLGDLSASNGRAIAMAREWWSGNSPYLFLNPATGRFDISEEAQRIGVPVDPKTGKPGR